MDAIARLQVQISPPSRLTRPAYPWPRVGRPMSAAWELPGTPLPRRYKRSDSDFFIEPEWVVDLALDNERFLTQRARSCLRHRDHRPPLQGARHRSGRVGHCQLSCVSAWWVGGLFQIGLGRKCDRGGETGLVVREQVLTSSCASLASPRLSSSIASSLKSEESTLPTRCWPGQPI